MGRILAIDYGKKRVGLAVTDPLQMIANGLTTVAENEVINYLKEYLQIEEVEAFVLGMPINLDGSPTDATDLVKSFEQHLSKTFPNTPIYHVDERFTSKIAVQSMVAGGMKKKDRRKKENIDRISATILLQSFLESR